MKKSKPKASRLNNGCDTNGDALSRDKIRRSIPCVEVEQLLEEQRLALKKEPTLFDGRLDLLEKLSNLEGSRDYHAEAHREFTLRCLAVKKELEEVNNAITEALQFDSLR